MTLPDNFNHFEHLQQTYKTEFNRKVDRYFSDVQGNGDLSGPRPSLKLACRIDDNDNHAMMDMRRSLFFDVIGYGYKNLNTFYGSRLDSSIPVAGHPQLFLYFSQDDAATPTEQNRIDHEKSCRLMKYSCQSGDVLPVITKTNMIEIANEIKTQFLDGRRGILYSAGKLSVSYTDPDKGFPKGNYWLVNGKAEGLDLYRKLCNCVDVVFDDNKIILSTPEKSSTTEATAGTTTILGKTVKKRRFRPVSLLRFRYAYISLGNDVKPIFLIDTTYRRTGLVNF